MLVAMTATPQAGPVAPGRLPSYALGLFGAATLQPVPKMLKSQIWDTLKTKVYQSCQTGSGEACCSPSRPSQPQGTRIWHQQQIMNLILTWFWFYLPLLRQIYRTWMQIIDIYHIKRFAFLVVSYLNYYIIPGKRTILFQRTYFFIHIPVQWHYKDYNIYISFSNLNWLIFFILCLC